MTDLERVKAFLTKIANFEQLVGAAIRRSLDEVIDGARTGRWSVKQLEKTEKTYIGTKVEIVLRSELGLNKGSKLDLVIDGIDVDIKWSLSKAWMIPRECVGEICLLVTADDISSTFSYGLVAATEDLLNKGCNQDGKKTLSRRGKECIDWIVRSGQLPRNFLLGLADDVRTRILSSRTGQARVVSLFRVTFPRKTPPLQS